MSIDRPEHGQLDLSSTSIMEEYLLEDQQSIEQSWPLHAHILYQAYHSSIAGHPKLRGVYETLKQGFYRR